MADCCVSGCGVCADPHPAPLSANFAFHSAIGWAREPQGSRSRKGSVRERSEDDSGNNGGDSSGDESRDGSGAAVDGSNGDESSRRNTGWIHPSFEAARFSESTSLWGVVAGWIHPPFGLYE